MGPLLSRCSSQLPAPPEGLWATGASAPPGRSRPAGPGEPRQPPAPPLSVPPSLRPSFPPERGLRAGVGGDFAGVSISYLAAKLSFCVSPSCSLQLLLSSEMPGQGKGAAGRPVPRGTRGPDGLGVPGLERGLRRAGGRCPDRPLLLSLFMQSSWAPERTQVKVKARTGAG